MFFSYYVIIKKIQEHVSLLYEYYLVFCVLTLKDSEINYLKCIFIDKK